MIVVCCVCGQSIETDEATIYFKQWFYDDFKDTWYCPQDTHIGTHRVLERSYFSGIERA